MSMLIPCEPHPVAQAGPEILESSAFQPEITMTHTRLALACTAVLVLLAACGKQEQAAAPASAPAPAAVAPAPAPAAAPADNALGKSIYNKTCAMCHAAGVAGAPKPGNKPEWEARIAQGMDVLFKRSIEGYTGSKGLMPAKGGNAALTDDETKAAVQYMVELSR